MEKKKCLIALSFGSGTGVSSDISTIQFGLSNYFMAIIAAEISNLPTIAQWEIARIMDRLGKPAVKSIEREGDKYLDSYDVLMAAQREMKKLGFDEAVLLGHKDHLPRIRLIAKKLGIKTSKITFSYNTIPYDKSSTQWWTRSWILFWPREILVYIFMFLKGQI